MHDVTFDVNGERRHAVVEPDTTLLDLLRNTFGLTGTKEGCLVGVCGACSILVNGELTSACLLLAVLADGSAVTTVEGLADAEKLSALQDAFIRHGGFQCGICTPGQLVAARALLDEQPLPDADAIGRWMMGNLCRCTGYYGIVRSVQAAADGR